MRLAVCADARYRAGRRSADRGHKPFAGQAAVHAAMLEQEAGLEPEPVISPDAEPRAEDAYDEWSLQEVEEEEEPEEEEPDLEAAFMGAMGMGRPR